MKLLDLLKQDAAGAQALLNKVIKSADKLGSSASAQMLVGLTMICDAASEFENGEISPTPSQILLTLAADIATVNIDLLRSNGRNVVIVDERGFTHTIPA
jgi:hypothetical protein